MSCCKKFDEAAGAMLSTSPIAMGYPKGMGADSQITHADGGWHVTGCCGGNCYVLENILFCPFCGKGLE